MKIIKKIINQIEEHRYNSSSQYLANALASACSSAYKVSLLDASVKLDSDNKKLITELANIAQQPDFSNRDQDHALRWLRENGFIDTQLELTPPGPE
ncbi:hypothetical protein TDB9533_01265 [Thalassocella blandensis]|nr:hypothetical protein TDB9533_01265 [Thalassocella blandensis]